MTYDRLNSLSYRDIAMPGEEVALNVLRKIPGLEKLLDLALSSMLHMTTLPEVQADMFRVTEKTYPRLYRLYALACSRLSIREMPPLFVKADFEFNAMCAGGAKPFVILHSSFAKLASDTALLGILGHELGHMLSGNQSYCWLAQVLVPLARNVPMVGELLTPALSVALMHWFRMHEYSADRAGAIAAGSPDGMIEGLGMCLGAAENLPGIHITTEDLLAQHQAQQEESDNLISRVILTSMLIGAEHPWATDRIHAMRQWKESGGFDQVIRKAA